MSLVASNNESSSHSLIDELFQIVTFNVGNEKFGVDILKVKEIIRMMEITRVPNTSDFVEGVINLRGKVIPVINIRSIFTMPQIKTDSYTRIIIIELETKNVGFIVDFVSEVLRIPRSSFEKPPELIANVETKYITSVGIWNKQMIILLDLDELLTTSE